MPYFWPFYIALSAFTRYVSEKGNANQNHSSAYISISIKTRVDTKNKIQSKPEDFFVVLASIYYRDICRKGKKIQEIGNQIRKTGLEKKSSNAPTGCLSNLWLFGFVKNLL